MGEIYGPNINALNGKVVGLEEEKYKGQGFITQIEPTLKFKFTYEITPAEIGDVMAVFLENDWKWDRQVWGELVKVGEGEPSGLSQ